MRRAASNGRNMTSIPKEYTPTNKLIVSLNVFCNCDFIGHGGPNGKAHIAILRLIHLRRCLADET